ncbi:thiamine pyrophosphate-dependent dehydrogenase E1 component subunit alpha ['Paenibacillus yunnanensis' Narsing Rao et al. 2020]|uniref:thiamine pyrophosphate-dependent dehydrogenase E1 component subunit alpha n=1 Tax=Paenibacillus tengchongensis TaxID=2608684 RepID=UPI00124DEF5B|nr:thiamine pyrophosphate-dependent dehydrogenase E1 component subunit alpha [Paenibacillus tengchongensis]
MSKAMAETLPFAGLSDEDLEAMLMIREFEMTVLELFSEGLIKGTAHTCIGQEYIPVALNAFIGEEDYVISNHRGHGHYLARYNDAEGLLAEVTGRRGAVCGGIGGSQHIRRGRFLSTGIQAEGIAVGAGIAWSYKYRKQEQAVFVYIGEGTFGRGCVYESLNFAGLWGLPMVIVVENNGIALSTPQSGGMSGSIEGRVHGFGIDYLRLESRDPGVIRLQVQERMARVRQEHKPLVLEFITDRVASHSKSDDTRSEEELRAVQQRYWYNRMKASGGNRFMELEQTVRNRMQVLRQDVMGREEAEWRNV